MVKPQAPPVRRGDPVARRRPAARPHPRAALVVRKQTAVDGPQAPVVPPYTLATTPAPRGIASTSPTGALIRVRDTIDSGPCTVRPKSTANVVPLPVAQDASRTAIPSCAPWARSASSGTGARGSVGPLPKMPASHSRTVAWPRPMPSRWTPQPRRPARIDRTSRAKPRRGLCLRCHRGRLSVRDRVGCLRPPASGGRARCLWHLSVG